VNEIKDVCQSQGLNCSVEVSLTFGGYILYVCLRCISSYIRVFAEKLIFIITVGYCVATCRVVVKCLTCVCLSCKRIISIKNQRKYR
jgi:hypothetical protein